MHLKDSKLKTPNPKHFHALSLRLLFKIIFQQKHSARSGTGE
jgi:hypothetical protein